MTIVLITIIIIQLLVVIAQAKEISKLNKKLINALNGWGESISLTDEAIGELKKKRQMTILAIIGAIFILLLIIYKAGKIGYSLGYKTAKNEGKIEMPPPCPIEWTKAPVDRTNEERTFKYTVK